MPSGRATDTRDLQFENTPYIIPLCSASSSVMPNKARFFTPLQLCSVNTPLANRFREPSESALNVMFSASVLGISASGSLCFFITSKISSPLFVESAKTSITFWTLGSHFEESSPNLNTPTFFPAFTRATVSFFLFERISTEESSTPSSKAEIRATAPAFCTSAIFLFFAFCFSLSSSISKISAIVYSPHVMLNLFCHFDYAQ